MRKMGLLFPPSPEIDSRPPFTEVSLEGPGCNCQGLFKELLFNLFFPYIFHDTWGDRVVRYLCLEDKPTGSTKEKSIFLQFVDCSGFIWRPW